MGSNPYVDDDFETTSAELLSIVNKAISKIIAGAQEYWMGNRKVTRADLDKLYALREKLQAEVSAAAGPAVNLADLRRRP